MDKQEIIDAINEAFNQRRGTIADEQHRLDHDFVAEMRARRMRWEKFWVGVRKTAIATMTVSVVGGFITFMAWLGKLVWHAVFR